MKVSGLFFAACGAVLLLGGCGGGTSSQNVNTPSVSPLAGNWLIAAPMPTNSLVGSVPVQHLRLAMTIDVVGSNLVAGGFVNHTCPGFYGSYNFPSVLTGTVAEDGTFSLGGPSAFPDIAIAMTGKAPSIGGASWPGSYTVSFGSLPGPIQDCVETLSDTFTATSFPLVNGVYAGTASSTTYINGVPTIRTMSLQVTLQQGGTATNPITGKTVTSNTVLTGRIKVQGSPCFSSGTTSGTPSSGVLGNNVHAQFAMDDGSTLDFTGTLTDASESQIATGIVLLMGGQCGGSLPPVAYRMAELDRVN